MPCEYGFLIGLQSMEDIWKLYSVTKKIISSRTTSGKNGRQQISWVHAQKSMYILLIVSRIQKKVMMACPIGHNPICDIKEFLQHQ